MTAELMVINPVRRRRRTKVRRNPRRKMTALQRKYFGPGHGKVTRRRRRRHASSVTVARRNPVRRRYHHKRRRIHVRRNPMPSTRGLTSTLTGAAIGAGGAIGLSYLWKTLSPKLPASLQSGMTGTLAQGAAAVALGWGASKVLGRNVGTGIAVGALTVIFFNLATSYMSGAGAGGLSSYGVGSYGGAYANLLASPYGGSYGYAAPALAGLGRPRRMMGRYVGMKGINRYVGMKGLAMRRARLRGLGYVGPARTFTPSFRKA